MHGRWSNDCTEDGVTGEQCNTEANSMCRITIGRMPKMTKKEKEDLIYCIVTVQLIKLVHLVDVFQKAIKVDRNVSGVRPGNS